MRGTLHERIHDYAWDADMLGKLRTFLEDGTFNARLILTLGAALILTCDKAATNFQMFQFLTWHCLVKTMVLFDPGCHGLHNACLYGLREAGVYATMIGVTVILNLKAGRMACHTASVGPCLCPCRF
jgi:hypothetical protein